MVYRKVLSVREQITQIRCKGTTKNAHMQIITSELEYGLHRANVATGELASAKAVSEDTAFY